MVRLSGYCFLNIETSEAVGNADLPHVGVIDCRQKYLFEAPGQDADGEDFPGIS